MSVCFCSLSISLSNVSLSQYLLLMFLCVLFHAFDEFLVVVAYRFAGSKIDEGNFSLVCFPNLATSDLFKTVSYCSGTLIVRVQSVDFTRADASGMASYMSCSCFLFLWAASVQRASWRRGLCRVRGCSMLEDGSLKVRGFSLVSLLASSSFFLLASRTCASLFKSSLYHFFSGISSLSPMMLTSKYLNGFDQLRFFLLGFVVMFIKTVFGFLP